MCLVLSLLNTPFPVPTLMKPVFLCAHLAVWSAQARLLAGLAVPTEGAALQSAGPCCPRPAPHSVTAQPWVHLVASP